MCDSEELEGSFILTDGALAEWGASEELEVPFAKQMRAAQVKGF